MEIPINNLSPGNNLSKWESNFPSMERTPAYGSPFGEQSYFSDPCIGDCIHGKDFLNTGIDFESIANDLNGSVYGSAGRNKKFDYSLYISTEVLEINTDEGTYKIPTDKNIIIPTGAKETRKIRVSGQLNKASCCIDPFPNPRISIKPDWITYSVTYHYHDAAGKEKPVINNATGTEWEIDDEYVAIRIYFLSADDMFAYLNKTNRTNLIEAFKNIITSKFNAALLKSQNSGSDLNSLYSRIPEFAIKEIGKMPGGEERLWADLTTLLAYDDTGRWSNFRDSSNAVINLLKGFPDVKTLYLKFYSNPALIKRIYDDMNGSSDVNGESLSNRTIFCAFINALCWANFDILNFTGKSYKRGNGYILDSNIDEEYDKDPNKIFLSQHETYKVKTLKSTGGGIVGASHYEYYYSDEEHTRPTGYEFYFHPMDIVTLTDFDSKLSKPFAAIFVKDISDKEEQAAINKRIRAGIDILIIVFSLATLATGPGAFLFIISLADTAVATADLFILSEEDELKKTESGRAFLKIWDNIYSKVGLATAIASAPMLIASAYRLGTKLLTTVKTITSRNFIASVLFTLIMEINISNVSKGTLRMVESTEVVAFAKPFLNSAEVFKLQGEGVIFMTAIRNTGSGEEKILVIVYEGEVIASGSGKTVREILSDALKAGNKTLEKILQGLLKRRRLISVEDPSLLGAAPRSGTKMVLKLIDEFGIDVGSLTRLPNGRTLEYKLILFNREIKLNADVRMLNASDGAIRGLPIYNNERLLFGDLNIPKEVTDQFTGLGQTILDDALGYFNRSKKYGPVDGTLNIWSKSGAYAEYGGQSINLEQFWRAVETPMSYVEAAFQTFSGAWAKKSGFTTVRFRGAEDITKETVILNFLKP